MNVSDSCSEPIHLDLHDATAAGGASERREAELETNRRVKCKGTARIRLEDLDFPRHGANENVVRLKLCIDYG